ncbi:hypothetical protein BRC81_13095 [Halobacteriales archaeon QS_1_68_20]|nr:MAG: hypothetical protein BRC81_13095 [Halobacteriales archaeon QS_1_68_20]
MYEAGTNPPRTMRERTGRRAFVAALGTAVGIAGCTGGSDDEGPDGDGPAENESTTPTATPESATTDGPVTLGLVTESDTYQGRAERDAADAAVAHLNDAGGVLGREVELVVREHDGKRTGELVDELGSLAEAGAVGVVHHAASGAHDWAAEAASREVMHVHNGLLPDFLVGAGDTGGRSYVAATGRDGRQDGLALGLALDRALHADDAALVYPRVHRSLADLATRGFSGSIATEVEYAPFGEPVDGEAVLDQLTDADPEAAVFLGHRWAATERVFRTAVRRGFDADWVTTGVDGEGVADIARDLPGSVYGVHANSDVTRGTSALDPWPEEATGRWYRTYDAVMLLALAVERTGTATGPAVAEHVRTVSRPPGDTVGVEEFGTARSLLAEGTDVDYRGASGAVDLGPGMAALVPFDVEPVGGGSTVAELPRDAFEDRLG